MNEAFPFVLKIKGVFSQHMHWQAVSAYKIISHRSVPHRARKSRTTLQNKVRLEVLPEQLTLFVSTSVAFRKCIIQ